jgi:hypothetical protein
MLEFIVLGQVPGTHVQLNFQEVLLFTLVTVILLKFALDQILAQYSQRNAATTAHDEQPATQTETIVVSPSSQQQA